MTFNEESLLGFANELADEASKITLKHFRSTIHFEDKVDQSPVTQADRDVEELLRAMIKKKYPSHGIIGEEYGSENEKAEFVWTLDPIDGTVSFINGVPLFTTLVGVIKQGLPFLGVIDQPVLKDRWSGSDKRIIYKSNVAKTRPCEGVELASLYTTAHEIFDQSESIKFKNLENKVRSSRVGGTDCYHYGMLASGWIDIVCEKLSVYEYSAIVPIVKGAGGLITNWNGQIISGFDYKTIIAVGDPTIHNQALDLLS
ncbi:MAG: hypothetical protein CBC47_04520 [Alphaproteobacteria bacterium TMED87]|nr:histidinol phosphate phosphatase [Rhodospirillaceae bacterium]OUV09760.1 MAG: hypothetical protein CBC47_04520 [Alphaproteobacteria bacterium TMED87]